MTPDMNLGGNIFGGGGGTIGGGSGFGGTTFGSTNSPRTPLNSGFGANTSTSQPWSLGATSTANASPQVGGGFGQQTGNRLNVPSLNFSSINNQQQVIELLSNILVECPAQLHLSHVLQ